MTPPPPLRAVDWQSDGTGLPFPGAVRIIDQTRLPGELVFLELRTVDAVEEAIRSLRVRGAPAIGIAAAYGVLTAMPPEASGEDITPRVLAAADQLATSRPTAVNLFYALDRMRLAARTVSSLHPLEQGFALLSEARAIREEDEAQCRAIGRHGLSLLDGARTILTHCNAGGLATSAYGTALAPVYLAREEGRPLAVIADETRPLLQGARLTTWELQQAGIEVTLICDNMAAQVMNEGRVDAVLVGADRIAANGDTANKIGTYGLSILARAHQIPFYVLAPTPTFDPDLPTGASIPIEQRGAEEVTCGFGICTAPAQVAVYNPAFDVTPAGYIDAIVCERGVLRPPYEPAIAGALERTSS